MVLLLLLLNLEVFVILVAIPHACGGPDAAAVILLHNYFSASAILLSLKEYA